MDQLRKYAPLWNKYRPAILKMMLAAASEPQQYELSSHEVLGHDTKKKGPVGFTLQISKRKAVNNIKNSEIAQDLLNTLQLSKRGSELIDKNDYSIVLDKQFKLHISQISPQNTESEIKTNE
jgi:hypothetical protein